MLGSLVIVVLSGSLAVLVASSIGRLSILLILLFRRIATIGDALVKIVAEVRIRSILDPGRGIAHDPRRIGLCGERAALLCDLGCDR